MTVAHGIGPLTTFRLRMVRVAIVLGLASVVMVVAGTLLPHQPHREVWQTGVWILAAAATLANTVLALLPWERLIGKRRGEMILTAWGAALVALVAALTYTGGGWTSDYYLLYFLVIPFIATTEPPRRQVALYALVLAGYLVAVELAPARPPLGTLVVRVGVLASACALAALVARIITSNAISRERAEVDARIERVLADEAHHRIKNNLQLVADLLTLEADKAGSELAGVVDETLSRIRSVAAVHQSLAQRGTGQVTLRPVIDRVVTLLADRLGTGRSVQVDGDESALPAQQATWFALVVNELVTNALRHGQGSVTVRFTHNGGVLDLSVADEGSGPRGAAAGLGFTLVHRLVEDGMHGTVTVQPHPAAWQVGIQIPIGVQDTRHARAHS